MAYRYSTHTTAIHIGAFLLLVTSLLLWFSAFSTPFIKGSYYLKLASGWRLGTFGYCLDKSNCSGHSVGYTFPHVPGGKHLTGSLILTPIAAGLSTLAFLLVVALPIRGGRGGFAAVLCMILGFLLALLSFFLALGTFIPTHHYYSNHTSDHPTYGKAIWMHLVSCVSLVVGVPFVIWGWIRMREEGRRSGPVVRV